jgi:hypothetical protein
MKTTNSPGTETCNLNDNAIAKTSHKRYIAPCVAPEILTDVFLVFTAVACADNMFLTLPDFVLV